MRRKPHLPRLYTTILYYPIQPYTAHSATIQHKEFMKKVYIAPQTEEIELLGENAIMVGSSLIIGSGEGDGGVMG